MSVQLNKKGLAHARGLIKDGKIDKDSAWDFSAEDGNKLLGPKGDDWTNYASFFLGEDTDEKEETKARYKYPYGKDEKVYRKGVIAGKQRAAQQGEKDIEDAADELLTSIDGKKDDTKKSAPGFTVRDDLNMVIRTAPVNRSSYDEKTHSIGLTLFSGNPVTVFDPERWEPVNEVVSMDGVKVPPSNQIPLLDCHDRSSIFNQLGSIRDLQREGNTWVGRAYFDQTDDGKNAEMKVRDGHVTDVSAGYRWDESTYVPAGQSMTMGSAKYDGPCRCTSSCTLREGSLTPVGADPSTKVRSAAMTPQIKAMLAERGLSRDATDAEAMEFLRLIVNQRIEASNRAASVGVGADDINQIQRSNAMDPVVTVKTPTPEELERQKQDAEKHRKEEIEAIGKNYAERVGGKVVMDGLVKDALELQRSAELFRGDVYTRVLDSRPLETPDSTLDLTNKDKKRYSITRAIRQLVDGKGGEMEMEMSNAIAKKVGDSKRGGIYVPYDIQRNEMDIPPHVQRQMDRLLARYGIVNRALSVGSTTAGGYLVGTEHRPQDFIELLRNALIQGFTILTGLSQNVDIPKQTGGGTITHGNAEAQAFSATQQVFGQMLLKPNDIGAYTEISRRLLVQSSPSVDALVAQDLMLQLGLMINYLALYGGGTNEPTGIYNTSGIGTVPGAALTWDAVLSFLTQIGQANVTGPLEWLMNSAVHSMLMGRPKVAGFPVFLIGDDGNLAGKPCQVSEQVAAGNLFCAKLSEVIVGEFGVLEIIYDRNSLSTSGGLRIAAYHSIDVGLRHSGAVSLGTGVN